MLMLQVCPLWPITHWTPKATSVRTQLPISLHSGSMPGQVTCLLRELPCNRMDWFTLLSETQPPGPGRLLSVKSKKALALMDCLPFISGSFPTGLQIPPAPIWHGPICQKALMTCTSWLQTAILLTQPTLEPLTSTHSRTKCPSGNPYWRL